MVFINISIMIEWIRKGSSRAAIITSMSVSYVCIVYMRAICKMRTSVKPEYRTFLESTSHIVIQFSFWTWKNVRNFRGIRPVVTLHIHTHWYWMQLLSSLSYVSLFLSPLPGSDFLFPNLVSGCINGAFVTLHIDDKLWTTWRECVS